MTIRKQCEKLYLTLQKLHILSSIQETNSYYDEPHYFLYTSLLNPQSSSLAKTYQFLPAFTITTAGISWISPEHAFLTCCMEAIERLSIHATPYLTSASLSLPQIKKEEHILSPLCYRQDISHTSTFHFVQGKNVLTNETTLIPAQLIYLSYLRFYDEPELSAQVSTGAAAGINRHDTLLRSIYEVIERDSIMCHYLLQIPSQRIAVDEIQNEYVQLILSSLKRYNLEPYVFDVTTDVGIPTYMTLIIDKSGIGPSVTVGTKAHLNSIEAIIGSLNESVLTRPFRRHMAANYNGKIKPIQPTHIATPTDRGLFWYPLRMLDTIKPLLRQTPQRILNDELLLSTAQQLKKLKDIFQKNGKDIYVVETTLDQFAKAGYTVLKVIIPSLQPLYFSEQYKILNRKRLSEVSLFFNVRDAINPIPHFFL